MSYLGKPQTQNKATNMPCNTLQLTVCVFCAALMES